MTVTAKTFPVTVTTPARAGSSTTNWASTFNIKADNGSVSSATAFGSGVYTPYIRAANFGFAIPETDTITNIRVYIDRRGNVSNVARDDELFLFDGTSQIGTNQADTVTLWSNVLTTVTYDMDALPTPVVVNSSGFGVDFSAYITQASRTANIDYIAMEITHEAAASPMLTPTTIGMIG